MGFTSVIWDRNSPIRQSNFLSTSQRALAARIEMARFRTREFLWRRRGANWSKYGYQILDSRLSTVNCRARAQASFAFFPSVGQCRRQCPYQISTPSQWSISCWIIWTVQTMKVLKRSWNFSFQYCSLTDFQRTEIKVTAQNSGPRCGSKSPPQSVSAPPRCWDTRRSPPNCPLRCRECGGNSHVGHRTGRNGNR